MTQPEDYPTRPGRTDAPTLKDGTPGYAPPAPNQTRGRRSKMWRRIGIPLLIILLVVAALLGDAVARQHVEASIADEVAANVSTDADTVGVTIGGWPFAAVLATDRLSSIDLSIPTATLSKEGRTVTFRDAVVHATGLRNVRNLQDTVVDEASASAHVDWKELSRLSGVTVSSGGDSRVQVERSISVFGATVTMQVSAAPGIDPATRTLTLGDPKANVDGIPVPSSLLTPALASVSDKLVLPDLGSLKYRSLTVDRRGVQISLAGTQVEVKDLLSS